MIAFVSIFLGLITGTKPVELAISGPVTEVELQLDGVSIGLLRGEPWSQEIDFGSDLTTHELIAIARGPRGAEIGRAVQLINIPRPHVETQVLLEDWQTGRPRSARLIWRSVEPTEPSSVSIILDGEVLADSYAERYDLPDLDPDSIHFLSARLGFPDNLSSSAEIVFGGIYGDSTETELTAVPLIADRKLRRADRLEGRLEADGEPLRVVAVEDGPAEVVFVRDRRSLPRLATLDSTYAARRDHYGSPGLKKKNAMVIMSPRAYLAIHPNLQYAVFPMSHPITNRDGSLPWMLASTKFTKSPVMSQQLSNAVATAGLRAASSQKRRAVVLVTSDCADVPGYWSPEGVRRYLAQLRVPFRVWLVEQPAEDWATAGGFCEGAQPIYTVRLYQAAIKRLNRDLQKQQIAWIEGRHLQRKISLAGDQPGVRLAD